MYSKLLFVILCAAVIAIGLLIMRQQRIEAMHEMAMIHRQINRDRQSLWEWQARIAGATTPRRLSEAIARAGIRLEPMTPGTTSTPTLALAVERDIPRH